MNLIKLVSMQRVPIGSCVTILKKIHFFAHKSHHLIYIIKYMAKLMEKMTLLIY